MWPQLISRSELPLLQYDNSGAVVATQALARQFNLDLFFTDMHQLHEQLSDQSRMARLQESVWVQREKFTFDYYVDWLVDFFRRVIGK